MSKAPKLKVFSQDIRIVGTVYVKAENRKEAKKKIKDLTGDGLEVSGALISGLQFDDENLPEISLSPAMTLHNPTGNVEFMQHAHDPEAEDDE